jgi:hypothetical protein
MKEIVKVVKEQDEKNTKLFLRQKITQGGDDQSHQRKWRADGQVPETPLEIRRHERLSPEKGVDPWRQLLRAQTEVKAATSLFVKLKIVDS